MPAEVPDAVHVLRMDAPTQVLNADTLEAMLAALDQVEATEGPAALVLVGEGKVFHQGLDLPWVMELGDQMAVFLKAVHGLFGRLLRTEVPTVAAINGHAIAAGAMLAQCTDLRIMRADRGWFRLPEVELRLPFTTVMDELLGARLPQPAQHRLMVLGERMDGAAAAAAGVVDLAVEGEEPVLQAAVERASALAVHRGPALAQIRTTRYRRLLATIDGDDQREDPFAP